MITYEEALKKAKSIKPNANICIEKTSAYIFGYDSGKEEIGGSNNPVVILKEDGKPVSMPYYNGKYQKDKEIKITNI